MIILIPLGGIGKRFKDCGYKNPKPLINVMGKPIIYWLLDNLDISYLDFIYIPYHKELTNYRFEDRLKKDYPQFNFKFYVLDNNTRGAAETVLFALNNLDIDDCSILCLDGDNFYKNNIIQEVKGNNICIFNDYSKYNNYSYVKLLNDNRIIDIKEKIKISNYASTGAYNFKSWKMLQKYCKYIINKNILSKNEFYISTVIQQMINDNILFTSTKINKSDYICLGTPLDVKLFCNNFPVNNFYNNKLSVTLKRYCFDLDNTLVTFPRVLNDYTTVEPIYLNIKYLKYLKKMGHTIIIYTARRMKTFNCNTGKVLQNIGKITFDTLEKFKIPYDEIHFGKPYADYYIDDLAISSYDDLEKEIGFYQTNIRPRDFNSIYEYDISVYRKKSNDLSGEIFYYKNIPNSIKDLFPLLINYDINNKWYDIEKISSIPLSKLYLSQELQINQLNNVLMSIVRIHDTNSNNTKNINIYSNYSNKIKKRYCKYDYSKYKNSNKIYNEIISKLDEYETKKRGKMKIIHGDPVFTNILINKFGKLKFIDMRGIQGETLTLYGDWLYDWSKIFQSLIGYDEILETKTINIDYKNKMINHFITFFTDRYSVSDFKMLKIITKSLLFSLIPLHNDKKCYKYYELIQDVDSYVKK